MTGESRFGGRGHFSPLLSLQNSLQPSHGDRMLGGWRRKGRGDVGSTAVTPALAPITYNAPKHGEPVASGSALQVHRVGGERTCGRSSQFQLTLCTNTRMSHAQIWKNVYPLIATLRKLTATEHQLQVTSVSKHLKYMYVYLCIFL